MALTQPRRRLKWSEEKYDLRWGHWGRCGEQGHVNHTGSREVHALGDDQYAVVGSTGTPCWAGGYPHKETDIWSGGRRIQCLHVLYSNESSSLFRLHIQTYICILLSIFQLYPRFDFYIKYHIRKYTKALLPGGGAGGRGGESAKPVQNSTERGSGPSN